jgi:hypothetical protein
VISFPTPPLKPSSQSITNSVLVSINFELEICILYFDSVEEIPNH